MLGKGPPGTRFHATPIPIGLPSTPRDTAGAGVGTAANGNGEEALMRYKVKSIDALQIALGGLPDKMRVEVGPNIGVSAKTVGELRKVTVWPENLVITTPRDRNPESAVEVSKGIVSARLSPKR